MMHCWALLGEAELSPARQPKANQGFHHEGNRNKNYRNDEFRQNLVQARGADPQGGGNVSKPDRQLHQAHRPPVHRLPRTGKAQHERSAEQSMVRLRESESKPLRFHALPRDQPEQRMADRHGGGSCIQRHNARRRGENAHSALPDDRGESPDLQVREHEKPAPLLRGKREVRHAGFPPPAEHERAGIQNRPPPPAERPAGKHGVETRQTRRSVRPEGGDRETGRHAQHGLQTMQAVL